MTPTYYSLTIELETGMKMDISTDGHGELLRSRSAALAEMRALVQEGFAREQIELLPMYTGPLFMPEYTTNHTESVL